MTQAIHHVFKTAARGRFFTEGQGSKIFCEFIIRDVFGKLTKMKALQPARASPAAFTLSAELRLVRRCGTFG